jgi:hypothetical protein
MLRLGQGSVHLARFVSRLDGLSSLSASIEGGQVVTAPITFEGDLLEINVLTSAAGSVWTEIRDVDGEPVPGFGLGDCDGTLGDEIAGDQSSR